MDELENKAVVITGAGSGIGAACAKLAAEMGARVVVNDVSDVAASRTAREIADNRGTAVAHVASIANWSEAKGLVERCISEFGAIDCLVNNAGIIFTGPIQDVEEADLRALIDVNVFGTMSMTAHALPQMLRQGKGSIVNVTSASMMGSARLAAYTATKGAIASFTYSCAIDLEGSGVRINAIAPRAQTGMTSVVTGHASANAGQREASPRPSPSTSAPGVCFLLSDASAHLHGQVLYLDGTQLSVINPPTISLPVSTSEEWSCAGIRSAFEGELSTRLAPRGIFGLNKLTGELEVIRRSRMAPP